MKASVARKNVFSCFSVYWQFPCFSVYWQFLMKWTKRYSNVLTNTNEQNSKIAALPREKGQMCPTLMNKRIQSQVLKYKTKARCNSAEVQDATRRTSNLEH